MKPNDVAIRKRTQIAKANKTMFIWIAIASALIGSAVVVSIFLTQKLFFNEKVLLEKQNTISALQDNNKVAPELEDAIRVLDTNQALNSAKANESDQAIQVILDALPSEANSLALGASLQNKLLAGIPGLVSVESLQVDSVIGVESLTGSEEGTGAVEGAGTEITFSFSVKGSQEAMKLVLQNLERSIRQIDVLSIRIEAQEDNQQLMTVRAKAYYEPSKNIGLQDKVVEP